MFVVSILVLIYVGLVYVRPQEYVLALQDFPILPVFMMGSVGVWLFQPNKSFEASQHWLLPVLMFAMALSVAASGWLGGSLITITEFSPIVALFYLISTSTDTLAKHRMFMITLAILTLVLALHGIDQIETGVGWSGAQVIEGRITYLGVFNDPNDLALAFVVALPMIGYSISESKRFIGKVFWSSIFAIVLYGIYLTNSRGGMLGAIALFILYFHTRYGTFRTSIITVIGLMALSLLPTRLDELDAGEASAAGRVDAWFEGIQLFLSKPILGVGKGLFHEHNRLTAHNSFVLAFAELGLVGYFFWLAFAGLSVYMVYKISTTSADQVGKPLAEEKAEWDEYRKIARTYLYTMLGFFSCAFFLSRSYNILLFILCALCVALYQSARGRWPQFASIQFGGIAGRIFAFEIGSIVFMFILVKILLLLG